MLDLTNLEAIKKILRENNLWPKKGYGQNFLVAKQPLISLIESAEISVDDVIVEIGPGLGSLTQELAKRAKLVLAIESDYNLVEYLRKYFKSAKNVKIIHQDILKFSLENLQIANDKSQITNKLQAFNDQSTQRYSNVIMKQCNNVDYKVVSNLPYNITSPVIRKFLESNQLPVTSDQRLEAKKLQATSYKLNFMVLMVQKEVAERLTAKPGSSDRGILTVMVELFGRAEIMEIVLRNCFYPVPSVDSAIIKISVDQPKISVDQHLFMRFVKAGFSQKRRQIHHPLAANLRLPSGQIKDILKSVDIDPTLRAEDLTVEEWVKLYKKLF